MRTNQRIFKWSSRALVINIIACLFTLTLCQFNPQLMILFILSLAPLIWIGITWLGAILDVLVNG